MKEDKSTRRRSEYQRAYGCISNQKRHDIWQENVECRQERRKRDFGHESWNWDSSSSDDECTCGCRAAANGTLVPYRDFSKSLGDLRFEQRAREERSSADSSPRYPSSPQQSQSRHQRFSMTLRATDKCVSTDDLGSYVEKATQTELSSKVSASQADSASVRDKKRTPKVRFTAPADQLRRNSTEAAKSRPNSAVSQSEYRASFMPTHF